MSVLQAIFRSLKRRQRASLGLLALLILGSGLEVAGIGFLVPLLENLESQGDGIPKSRVSQFISDFYGSLGVPFALWTIMVGGFLLFTVQAVLAYLRETLTVKIAGAVGADVRKETFHNLLHMDLAYIHRKKGGELANSLITETSRVQSAYLQSVNLVARIFEAFVYLALALVLAWPLVLVVMGLVLAASLVVKLELGLAARYGKRLTKINQNLHTTTIEHLGGLRILKAFNLEAVSFEALKKHAEEQPRLYYLIAKSRSRIGVLFEAIMVGGLLLIVYFAVTVFDFATALLLTFIFVLYRFYPRIAVINKAVHSITGDIPGVLNVLTLIEETRSPSIYSGRHPFSGLEDRVRFEGVTFGYDGDRRVLKDINLSIERGETTAVVGTSGAGKTTLVNLLMRFYDPSSGRVLVDGTDLRELDLQAWRASIALVNQDIFLFNDTIGNNIALGKQGATEAEIREAARQSYADEFVLELPDGYDTVIGDRGVRLSGGQRQRIALARAVIRDPQILILDEATSELDSKSEQLVRQAIDELAADRTVFVIAHRLSSIMHADRILVLEDGRIVEEGSHEDLLQVNGQYAEFVRTQEATTPTRG